MTAKDCNKADNSKGLTSLSDLHCDRINLQAWDKPAILI